MSRYITLHIIYTYIFYNCKVSINQFSTIKCFFAIKRKKIDIKGLTDVFTKLARTGS